MIKEGVKGRKLNPNENNTMSFKVGDTSTRRT